MSDYDEVEHAVSHLELVAKQVREQGDVAQVLLGDDGVSQAPTLADELWLIAYNLRAVLPEHDKQVRAQELRDAADYFTESPLVMTTVEQHEFANWLRARAGAEEGK
jgi:hypothetical protein